MALKKFEESMLTAGEKLMVTFKAPWCNPCKMFTPVLEKMAEEGVNLAVVDTDEDEELTMKYGIRSVPTTIIFEGQDLKKVVPGSKTKGELTEIFESF